MAARRGLMEQDLSKLDVAKLNPLSPEVISRQATINIGMPLVTVQFSFGCLLLFPSGLVLTLLLQYCYLPV